MKLNLGVIELRPSLFIYRGSTASYLTAPHSPRRAELSHRVLQDYSLTHC